MLAALGIGAALIGMALAGATAVRKKRAAAATASMAQPGAPDQTQAQPNAGGGGGQLAGLAQQALQQGVQQGPVAALGAVISVAAVEATKQLGGSELEQQLAGVNAGTLGTPIITARLVDKGLEALGVQNATVRVDTGQSVALAIFAPQLLPAFATVKVGLKLVNLFKGDTPRGPPPSELISQGEAARYTLKPLALADMVAARRRDLAASRLLPYTSKVKVRVAGEEVDGPPAFRLMADRVVVTPDIYAVAPKSAGRWQEHVLRVNLAGKSRIALAYPGSAQGPQGFRTLWVDWIEVDGLRYQVEEATYYRMPEAPGVGDGRGLEIRGEHGMRWTGVQEWELKPQNRLPPETPVRVPSGATATEQAEWDAATRFVP
jgi:hypothetical protein